MLEDIPKMLIPIRRIKYCTVHDMYCYRCITNGKTYNIYIQFTISIVLSYNSIYRTQYNTVGNLYNTLFYVGETFV